MIRWRHNRRAGLGGRQGTIRVLCLGDEITNGWVSNTVGPNYRDVAGVGYVERMAQTMSPTYEIVNAGGENCTLKDYDRPADETFPDRPHLGGAFEWYIEQHLTPVTRVRIDLATLFFGPLDAAKLTATGLGWFEDNPSNWAIYAAGLLALCGKLIDGGVRRCLLLTPLGWEDIHPIPNAVVESRLLNYTTVIEALAVSDPSLYSSLNLSALLDQAVYYPSPASPSWWWPDQAGHDLLAETVGSRIRQMRL